MAHEACESNVRLVVRSSMHPCPGNWVEIGRAVIIMPRHLVQELYVGTAAWI